MRGNTVSISYKIQRTPNSMNFVFKQCSFNGLHHFPQEVGVFALIIVAIISIIVTINFMLT